MTTLSATLAQATRNDRVCPQPQKWNELYSLLPNRRRIGGGWEPPLPLILAAWWDTPANLKAARLREHIEWADKHGALEAVLEFLTDLEETEWFHIND